MAEFSHSQPQTNIEHNWKEFKRTQTWTNKRYHNYTIREKCSKDKNDLNFVPHFKREYWLRLKQNVETKCFSRFRQLCKRLRCPLKGLSPSRNEMDWQKVWRLLINVVKWTKNWLSLVAKEEKTFDCSKLVKKTVAKHLRIVNS